MKEFLEKNWVPELSEEDSIRLTVKALLEVVDSGSKNMEIAIMRNQQPVAVRYLPLMKRRQLCECENFNMYVIA